MIEHLINFNPLYSLTETATQIHKQCNEFLHSFFKQDCFEKKCLWVAGFLQSDALYASITHDSRSEYNQQKSECSEGQWSWWIWGCFETPSGPLRKFLGSKDHLNWLKIDLNAAEIITIQDYKHAQN